MAIGIKTLINIKSVLEEIREEDERKNRIAVYERIYDAAKRELEGWFGSNISCVCDFDGKDVDQTWAIGTEDPAAVIARAEEWNTILADNVEKAFDALETTRENLGLAKIANVIRMALSESAEVIPHYNSDLYTLRLALSAVHDVLQYGSECAIVEGEDYSYEVFTTMPDETLENVRKHPEDYAVIWVYYK